MSAIYRRHIKTCYTPCGIGIPRTNPRRYLLSALFSPSLSHLPCLITACVARFRLNQSSITDSSRCSCLSLAMDRLIGSPSQLYDHPLIQGCESEHLYRLARVSYVAPVSLPTRGPVNSRGLIRTASSRRLYGGRPGAAPMIHTLVRFVPFMTQFSLKTV